MTKSKEDIRIERAARKEAERCDSEMDPEGFVRSLVRFALRERRRAFMEAAATLDEGVCAKKCNCCNYDKSIQEGILSLGKRKKKEKAR